MKKLFIILFIALIGSFCSKDEGVLTASYNCTIITSTTAYPELYGYPKDTTVHTAVWDFTASQIKELEQSLTSTSSFNVSKKNDSDLPIPGWGDGNHSTITINKTCKCVKM